MIISSQNDLLISDLFKGDLQLASPPTVYFQLQEVIKNPNKTVVDAAFVIEKDAGLSIRLLKIVNSAFYGFPAEISSIDRAINLIGTKELQNITLATIVIDKFSGFPSDLVSMGDFWSRNLRCALIAQGIDRQLGKQFSESIFICGILHHIGQLVCFQKLPELAKEVLLMLQSTDDSTTADEIRLENNIIGFDHFAVGAALTELWKLPQDITDSIRLHPYPDSIDNNFKIASIVRVADSYSKFDGFCDENQASQLNISATDISMIIDKAYDQFEEVFKIFYPG
ncbi:MAG: HDOD domain-containing protein [Methylococcales bacterium]